MKVSCNCLPNDCFGISNMAIASESNFSSGAILLMEDKVFFLENAFIEV